MSPLNVEPLQIVSYTEGQKFNTHHDSGTLNDDGSVDPVPPRRVITFFLYLNSMPEGNGHTRFPELGLSVQPQRNTAVLFCNILPNGLPDSRLVHCAEPVVTPGLRKFGMNIWITDSSMQHLASVPAASPLTCKLSPGSNQLVITGKSNQCKNDNPITSTTKRRHNSKDSIRESGKVSTTTTKRKCTATTKRKCTSKDSIQENEKPSTTSTKRKRTSKSLNRKN